MLRSYSCGSLVICYQISFVWRIKLLDFSLFRMSFESFARECPTKIAYSSSNKMLVGESTENYAEFSDDLGYKRVESRSQECSKDIVNYSSIEQFYENQCIFVTGGTGFLGKILIEKLLRSCPGISKIFVLIREKKSKKVSERIKKLLQDPAFDSIRSSASNVEKKIRGIAGDCSLENLGLSVDDAELLIREASVVFHVAATVRFDEKLNRAVAINVRSTSTIVDLCKQMENLKSFVHVSTAYANCFASDIEEKLYKYPITHKELFILVDSLSEETMGAITPQLMKAWPNTYTFTKALAEDLIRLECANLPVAIFRPGVVTPAAYEPAPGWIDNHNGFVGTASAIASGVMRTGLCDPKGLVNFVPVDLTVNALIASAWDSTLQTNRKADDMLIYNFTSINDAPITWAVVVKKVVKYLNAYPLQSAVWCAVFRITKNRFIYNFYILLLHLIPAFFIDFGMVVIGRKPRLSKVYVKIHKMVNVLSHFSTNSWRFRDDNVKKMWNRLDARDQRTFRFSMLDFDWERYFENYIKGIRVYLFKDDLKTLETSRKKYARLLLLNKLIVALLLGFVFWVLWIVCWMFW